MDDRLTPSGIYELIAEVGFKKYFHFGGFDATRALIDLCPNSLIRRPRFRKFIKMSIAVPHNLLDYFGYGLYVGRTREVAR